MVQLAPVAVMPDAFKGAEKKILPDACNLRDELADKLAQFQREARDNHLQSPTRRMALHVSCMAQQGDVSVSDLSDLVRLLTINAFKYRSQRLRSYVGEVDVSRNEDHLRSLFADLAQDDGQMVAFETFRQRVEREVFGIVITAHPTFTVSEELTRAQASLAVDRDEDARRCPKRLWPSWSKPSPRNPTVRRIRLAWMMSSALP